jgi:hypothetical protein
LVNLDPHQAVCPKRKSFIGKRVSDVSEGECRKRV